MLWAESPALLAGQEGGAVDFEAPGLDYEQLAVHIMVKFRADEPLQARAEPWLCCRPGVLVCSSQSLTWHDGSETQHMQAQQVCLWPVSAGRAHSASGAFQ